uniref:Uncharacterized protein n=1 Tax=Avena sativa TaxID=4498 RepID=A0ACD5WC21_AVESA
MAQVAAQLQLPDHILACVLRRLAPRSLAASRCVCKTWRAVIDDSRLLRTDLLPHSLHGIFFMEKLDPSPPKFIANPMTTRRIAAAADFDYVHAEYDGHHLNIKDHCNGLLLLWDLVVVDPATRRCACLPPPPPPPLCAGMEVFEFYDHVCLSFDPTVSRHYQVLLLHNVPLVLENTTMFTKESEWPPSPYPVRVFSSETWRWEERLFVRRGSEPPGTIADMQSSRNLRGGYVVYWKGSVYMHCQNDSIMRLTLSDGAYEVIKPPKTDTRPSLCLGKSMEGVYCALIYNNMEHQLQVWLLTELSGTMEWTLKIDASLVPVVAKFSWVSFDDGNKGPWILHKGWCDVGAEDVGAEEAPTEDNSEWDFGNGIILEKEDIAEDVEGGGIDFLGFHPYKDIVFLWVSEARVVAYDFSSSKVQDLGQLRVQSIGGSFPYTPCWLEELFEKN